MSYRIKRDDITDDALLNELAALRRRVAELEALEVQHKKAEEALKESEEKYRHLFENVPIGIYRTTPDGRILTTNNSLIRMLGYSSFEELSSINLEEEDAFQPAYLRSEFKELVEREGQVIGRESQWTRLDGTPIFIRENTRAIRGQDGVVLYYEGTVEDITEQKKVEKSLVEWKNRYEALIQASGQLIYDWNPHTHEVIWSGDIGKILGYSVQEMEIKLDHWVELVHPDDRDLFNEEIERVLSTKDTFHLQYRARKKDGTYIIVEDKGYFFLDKAGNIARMVGFVIDITDAMRAEEALRESLARLSKMNRYETIISTVTRSVHQTINLQEVLENAVEAMSKNIDGVEHVAIHLVEGEDAVMRAYRGHPDWFVERVRRISYPKGFTWKTIIEGKPRYCPDVDQDTVIGPAGREVGTKSYLSLPIRFEGKTAGCINVHSFQKNAFGEEDLKQLEIVAQQIEVAINNAQRAGALNESLAQLSKKNRYETIIRRVIESVHQSINLQDVLEHAVDAMNKNIEGVESIFISMVEGEEADPTPREAVLKAYRGYPDWFIERIRRIPYPKGATWKTIIEGKLLYCRDAEKDTVIGPAGKEIGTKSYACMPIHVGDETVGCMSINSLEKDAFDDEELKLLEIVAKQIEIAVNNAKQADALRTQKEKLELRIQERTKELAEMNVELRKEIDWRMRIEKALRKRTEKIIQHHKVLLEIARMDNSDLDSVLRRITEVDAETLSTERVSVWFFNEDRSAIICKDLYKSSVRDHESGLKFRVKDHPTYFQALEESRILGSNDACTDSRTSEFAVGYLKPLGITSMMDVPIRVYGTVVGVVCHEHVGMMREWTSEEQDFVASIADMISLAIEASERRRAEDQVRASLAEKEILLKEIHHRVKNNLQVICSLLNLQSSYIDDVQTRERLKESQDRVKAMALIHETLYRSKDLARVDLGEYIKRLSALLLRSYMPNSKQIRMDIDVDNVFMSVDKAIPCGLIINEIVSNSIKHAFPVKRKGRVGISLSSVNSIRAESSENGDETDKKFVLIVGNNGVQFPKGLDFRNSGSLGLQLVCALTDQLNGRVELNTKKGTEFKITFPV